MTGKEMTKDETDPNHKKLKDSMTLELVQHTLKYILEDGKHDSYCLEFFCEMLCYRNFIRVE